MSTCRGGKLAPTNLVDANHAHLFLVRNAANSRHPVINQAGPESEWFAKYLVCAYVLNILVLHTEL